MQIEDYEKEYEVKDEVHEMLEVSWDLALALSITIFLPRQTLTPSRSTMLDVVDGTTRSMRLGREA